MKLIVGLGNPDAKYNFTRHNFGFLCLDFLAKCQQLSWQKPKFGAIWLKTDQAIWIKPQDYYNNSGQAVQAFAQFYKIPPRDILIVCDDFDLDFGQTRLRLKGSSGGNNGLKSVTTHLQTSDFPRLRLGTNNNALRRQIGDIDFVLSKFTPEEKIQLPTILNAASAKLQDWLN